MNNLFELNARFDGRKSFYGKAIVNQEGNTLTLYSYNTRVAIITDGIVTRADIHNWSRTTDRHIREFIRQFATDQNQDLNKILTTGA